MSDDDEPLSPAEAPFAALLEAALTARPERVEDGMLALAPPEVVAGLRDMRSLLAQLAHTAAPVPLPPGLRARILASARNFAPKRALVVQDMIVDHLASGGPLEVPRAREIVPEVRTLLDRARGENLPVVYILDTHEPGDVDLDAWGTHAVRGTKGAEVWPDLAPLEGEHLVTKHTYSAFYGTNLEALLESLGVDTLVLTGCLTEIGLFATACDAYQRGFAVEVPDGAHAGSAELIERAAVTTLRAMAPYGPARAKRLAALAAAG